MTTPKAPRAWQRMLSGRRLDLLDPSPLDVELIDIAHGLARVARWNGQTSGDHAFSVAQHSLVVEDIFRRFNDARPQECLMALLHDAPEYVIGDMISPFKSVVGGGYKTVEKRLEAAVHLRFGLPPHPRATSRTESKGRYDRRLFRSDRACRFHTCRGTEILRPAARHQQGHADDRALAGDRSTAVVLRALRRD